MYNIENLKSLPETYGVYIMKNKYSDIIYVGKANNVKSRVKQYFNGTDKRLKIEYLRKEIENIEYIVTSSEMESLILENNLIKENKPKYNTLLKDSKTYPYIEVSMDDEYPMVKITRQIKNNKSKYFGPFPDQSAANNICDILNKIYKLRTCPNLKNKECMYYHINTCSAPCISKISKEDYNKNIEKCLNILNGNISEISKEFKEKMLKYSESLEFETANIYKKYIEDLKYITSNQRITNTKDIDEDIIVYKKDTKNNLVVLFNVRNGKIIGKKHFFMKDVLDENILESFILQYYIGGSLIPKNIVLEEEIDETIAEYLEKIKTSKVNIIIPKRGDKIKLINLAKQNLDVLLNEAKRKDEFKLRKSTEGIENIKKILGLENISRIESFDISNTSGILNVASMVVFENNKFNKKSYRKFKLKFKGSDDYSCMKEVLERRFSDENLLKTLPDLILMDGGKGQINAAKEILKKFDLNIPVAGMVKDDNHNTRGLLFNDVEKDINKNSYEFKLITSIQDETHNFAINYHRKLRSKKMTTSILDKIDGIGEKKRNNLLKYFSSIEEIKNASIKELCKVDGINEKLAEKIKESLK